ncbi:phage terminase large subunit family protein [Bradyrhizobium sp. CB3481]|uniref:phage terminase large subunit family protein n=1 Tax=Bradyrhizobium sp. CB3481 TaxID=3039158 RepID=UPI0032C20E3F
MKGAQLGATEAGLNWVGYVVSNAPGLMLYVMPTTESARRNVRTRIDPLIESTPAVRDRVTKARSRDPGNTATLKSFPSGQIAFVGANSAVGLRSTPARYIFLDEVDGYPHDADGEGDPIALAIQRTVTFRGRRKIFMVSTPTIEGASRIAKAFAESDQRRFFVPARTVARSKRYAGRKSDGIRTIAAALGISASIAAMRSMNGTSAQCSRKGNGERRRPATAGPRASICRPCILLSRHGPKSRSNMAQSIAIRRGFRRGSI